MFDWSLHVSDQLVQLLVEIFALVFLHVVGIVVREVEGGGPEVSVLHALDDDRLGGSAYCALSHENRLHDSLVEGRIPHNPPVERAVVDADLRADVADVRNLLKFRENPLDNFCLEFHAS